MLGESQTRPRAEGIEHTVEIFSFLREVIRAAAVINSPIISMTFDKEGLILAFFPNRWKIGFLNMRLFIISVIGPAIISATIHKINFKHDEGIILARVQRDFKNTTPVSQNTAF